MKIFPYMSEYVANLNVCPPPPLLSINPRRLVRAGTSIIWYVMYLLPLFLCVSIRTTLHSVPSCPEDGDKSQMRGYACIIHPLPPPHPHPWGLSIR